MLGTDVLHGRFGLLTDGVEHVRLDFYAPGVQETRKAHFEDFTQSLIWVGLQSPKRQPLVELPRLDGVKPLVHVEHATLGRQSVGKEASLIAL